MGNCVGGFKRRTQNIGWPSRRISKNVVIGFLGLDGAGKTTVLKALQNEGAEAVHPTMGFSRGEFTLHRCRVVAYDLGGAERIREIWKTYYGEVYGIVFVVDSAAASRLEEVKSVVETLRSNPSLTHKPILFLLNKADLPNSIDEMAFSEECQLHSMACDNKTDIRVEAVCGVKGHGKEIDPMIVEGVQWLLDRIIHRYAQLHKEIETAIRALKERQAHERLQRQHRLANLAAQRETEAERDNEAFEATEEEIIAESIPKPPNGDVIHSTSTPSPPPKQPTQQTEEQKAETSEPKKEDKKADPFRSRINSAESASKIPRSTALRSNRVAPDNRSDSTKSIAPSSEYKLFETEGPPPPPPKKTKRSSSVHPNTLRNSRILFQPGTLNKQIRTASARRPQLLMQHDGGTANSDLERTEPTPDKPSRLNKRSSLEEDKWT